MTTAYDNYYQAENLFGEPYPELIDFFSNRQSKEKLLDLGCGQGRDAIALARMGFAVTGIDNSKVGIDQMNQVAKVENLQLIGLVRDIYKFDKFDAFDIILLDSMFHFAQKDKPKEIELLKRIGSKIKSGCTVVICIQDTGKKVKILKETIDSVIKLNRLLDTEFKYVFEDRDTGHKSETNYRMVVFEK